MSALPDESELESMTRSDRLRANVENCFTCKFWDQGILGSIKSGVLGSCQRHGPEATRSGRGDWPHTRFDDGCGDHEERS